MKYQNDHLLYQTLIRTSNQDSVLIYYVLEAQENLCFYSTLDFKQHQSYRDVEIKCTIEMKDELQQVLNGLKKDITLEKLSDRQIRDDLR